MQNFVERTGDNALLLTAFALAFSPVSPLSVAANAATKEGLTGRKQNKQSEFCCLPVINYYLLLKILGGIYDKNGI